MHQSGLLQGAVAPSCTWDLANVLLRGAQAAVAAATAAAEAAAVVAADKADADNAQSPPAVPGAPAVPGKGDAKTSTSALAISGKPELYFILRL